jgi:hypothetical protein
VFTLYIDTCTTPDPIESLLSHKIYKNEPLSTGRAGQKNRSGELPHLKNHSPV